MRRIDTDRATDDGLFQPGTPGVLLPTAFSARWCNNVQEELASVIEAGGLTLKTGADADDFTQLLAAIRLVAADIAAPVGAILPYTGTTAPAGWLLDGQTGLLRATYPRLWTWVSTVSGNLAADGADYIANPGKYGVGDGATTFDLPRIDDFIRGITGRTIGTLQLDAVQEFGVTTPEFGGGGGAHGLSYFDDRGGSSDPISDTITGVGGAMRFATETRPRNVAYPHIIKY